MYIYTHIYMIDRLDRLIARDRETWNSEFGNMSHELEEKRIYCPGGLGNAPGHEWGRVRW